MWSTKQIRIYTYENKIFYDTCRKLLSHASTIIIITTIIFWRSEGRNLKSLMKQREAKSSTPLSVAADNWWELFGPETFFTFQSSFVCLLPVPAPLAFAWSRVVAMLIVSRRKTLDLLTECSIKVEFSASTRHAKLS